jgi:hypothetical protein
VRVGTAATIKVKPEELWDRGCVAGAEPPSAHPPGEGNGFPEPRPYPFRAGFLCRLPCTRANRFWATLSAPVRWPQCRSSAAHPD